MVDEDAEALGSRYLEIFHRHVSDFSLHLSGSEPGRSRDQLEPSFYPPAGFWSTGDKNAFFHSLARHSRLRPDLIASDIPGKSIADVCVYLDLLAEAAEDAPKLKQSLSKPAYESSDDWIEFEEQQASRLCSVEVQESAKERAAGREQQLEYERKAMTHVFGERQAPEVYKEEYKRVDKAMKDVKEQLDAKWAREDFVRELDVAKLKTLDYISAELSRTKSDGKDQDPPSDDEQPAEAEPSDRNAHAGGASGGTKDDDVDVSRLSPASRRRHTKKMYMRRKRAEKSGKAVSTAFSRPKETGDSSSSQDGQSVMPRPPNITLLKEFAAKGIDACFLENQGLALFDLQAIGDLIG